MTSSLLVKATVASILALLILVGLTTHLAKKLTYTATSRVICFTPFP